MGFAEWLLVLSLVAMAIIVIAVALSWRAQRPSEVGVPEIPTTLEPDPPKVFLDPFAVQELNPESVVTMPFETPKGRGLQVELTAETAKTYSSEGLAPYRKTMRECWETRGNHSGQYCRCSDAGDAVTGEMFLDYFYDELFGGCEDFDETFDALNNHWRAVARDYGLELKDRPGPEGEKRPETE